MSEKEELQQRIADIEAIEQLYRDRPEIELAELMHNILCSWNHADGCGWCYESWEKPGHARNDYLNRARKLISQVGLESALKVFRSLNGRKL